MTTHSSPRRCLPPASGVGRCDLGTSHAPAVALSGPTTAPPRGGRTGHQPREDVVTAPRYDPDRWPLSPGNAPPEVEAALQAALATAPEPSADTRARVQSILRRADRTAVDRPTGT